VACRWADDGFVATAQTSMNRERVLTPVIISNDVGIGNLRPRRNRRGRVLDSSRICCAYERKRKQRCGAGICCWISCHPSAARLSRSKCMRRRSSSSLVVSRDSVDHGNVSTPNQSGMRSWSPLSLPARFCESEGTGRVPPFVWTSCLISFFFCFNCLFCQCCNMGTSAENAISCFVHFFSSFD
jgi:hypothetical protein